MISLDLDGSTVSYETWVAAISSSACIGFTSLVPWLFNLTFFEQSKSRNKNGGDDDGSGENRMKYLLSFAIGAILGDIFFHLIPESIDGFDNRDGGAHRKVGVSVIAGMFMFVIVEMILQKWSSEDAGDEQSAIVNANKNRISDTTSVNSTKSSHNTKETSLMRGQEESNIDTNNNQLDNFTKCKHPNDTSEPLKTSPDRRDQPTAGGIISPTSALTIDPAGYLNLIANGFDNFTHGLAIGASFLVGPKVGLLTTFVIIIHEIPHEICDYAILVNSGFSRWDAVKAQSSVSLFGILGTGIALYVKSVDKLNARTSWILPFSAGGFLHIALVTLLPDILERETSFNDSLKQVGCVILGILFMGSIALF